VKTIGGLITGLVLLASCGEQDIILPGERLDVRPSEIQANEDRPIRLAAQVSNSEWTHRNGGVDHHITHPALSVGLTQVFSSNIGEGDSRRARITADPVVAAGVVFTLDSRARVTATATSGQTLWAVDVTPSNDGANDASGGGLAVSNGRVFVTTGFGELTTLDAASGAEIWTQDLDAPGGSAPTVSGDLVYLVSRDSTAWAIKAENGRVRWQLNGTPSIANFSGGAGAATNGELVVFPFPSGEVIGAFPQGGLQRWTNVVSGERLGQASAAISDIAGDPVIIGDRVYVANFSGRLVAMNIENGERIWTSVEAALSPVWPAGDSVFLVNELNQLVRLDASDGSSVWKVELPQYEETRVRGLRTVYANYGPVLAGGRLIVASSDGFIREYNPASGALIGATPIAGGAASNPVIAGQTLYVVSKDGQLVAFR
jgi:outer membrane protein assembly factor BamB